MRERLRFKLLVLFSVDQSLLHVKCHLIYMGYCLNWFQTVLKFSSCSLKIVTVETWNFNYGLTMWIIITTVHLPHPPFLQINLALLIFSFTGFLLPGYLFWHCRQLTKEKKAREKLAADQEMEALNHTTANGCKPHTNGFAAIDA